MFYTYQYQITNEKAVWKGMLLKLIFFTVFNVTPKSIANPF